MIVRVSLILLLICAAACAAGDPAKGSDWPNWLGPNYDMTSNEKGLLREWPAGGPEVLWRIKIKQGWSCPSVSGNDLVLAMTSITNRMAEREMVVCYDVADGKQKWEYGYPTRYDWGNQIGWGTGGVRATPAITDKYVFSIDPYGHIVCLDRKQGALVWEKALKPEFFFAPGVEQKGYNNSPIVIDGVLVLHGMTGEKGKHFNWAMGLDPATGKQLWLKEDQDREKGIHYADGGGTAIPITINKELCDLASYNGNLRIFRAKDGKEILKFRMFPGEAHATGATPQLVGNKVIVLPFASYLTCAEIDLDHPEAQAKITWASTDYYGNGGYHNYVHYNGYLYGVNGYNTDGNDVMGKTLTFDCIDFKNGKRVWSQGGIVHGYSYIVADGLMFLRTFQTLSLLELSPEKFIVKSKVEKIHSIGTISVLDARGLADCVMPVLSRGRLYVRTADELICFDVKDHNAR